MAGSDIDGAAILPLVVGDLTFTAYAMGEGPLVLLIHGFPDEPQTFRHQLPALAAAGFRAVAVTSRGYEDSSRPADGNYTVVRLAGDVIGWIDALGAQKAHLVGHDWGANLAFAAARAAPKRVESLTLMAVPHPTRLGAEIQADKTQLRRSSYIFFFQIRGLAEFWASAWNAALVERMWRKWSPGWRFEPSVIASVRRRLARRKTMAAAMEYYRQLISPRVSDAEKSRALVSGLQQVRTLGIAGENDNCIGIEVFMRAMKPKDFPGGLEVVRIQNAGHFMHQEQPDAVAQVLVKWLRLPLGQSK